MLLHIHLCSLCRLAYLQSWNFFIGGSKQRVLICLVLSDLNKQGFCSTIHPIFLKSLFQLIMVNFLLRLT